MTLWTVACQASLPMGFFKQEYWSGLPFPSPGDLPNPGIKPVSLVSPVLAGRFFTTSAIWEAHGYTNIGQNKLKEKKRKNCKRRQRDQEQLYTVSKNGADCDSDLKLKDLELLITKFRLKLKKSGENH